MVNIPDSGQPQQPDEAQEKEAQTQERRQESRPERRREVRFSRNLQDSITLLLSILAIVFAIWHAADFFTLKRRMSQVLNGVSTRYLGSPPSNIKDIDDVVSGTNKNLDIMADVVGYGQYHKPEECWTYLTKIEGLRNRSPKVPVRIVVFSKELERQALTEQFPEKSFEKEKRSQEFHEFFTNYHRNLATPQSYEQFIDALLQAQLEWQASFTKQNIQVRTVDARFQVYLWLQDDTAAVMSFQTPAGEISFRTSDGNLNKTFHLIFERTWQEAHPLS